MKIRFFMSLNDYGKLLMVFLISLQIVKAIKEVLRKS